jgi:type III restriction enzyme
VFELAHDLTRDYLQQPHCATPAHVLFPQLVHVVERYLNEKVEAVPPANRLDVFLSPYYGWVIERLVAAIQPDTAQGEAPELPAYETNRGQARRQKWTSGPAGTYVKWCTAT